MNRRMDGSQSVVGKGKILAPAKHQILFICSISYNTTELTQLLHLVTRVSKNVVQEQCRSLINTKFVNWSYLLIRIAEHALKMAYLTFEHRNINFMTLGVYFP
jgi:hypothetical protein